MAKYKILTLENVTLMFPRVLTPVDTYTQDGKEFLATLVMTEDQKQAIIDLGLSETVMNVMTGQAQSRFKTDELTGLPSLKVKKRVRFDDHGKMLNPLSVTFPEGGEEALIGNGSTADVDLVLSEIKRRMPNGSLKDTGVLKATLGSIRVTNLIPYESDVERISIGAGAAKSSGSATKAVDDSII